MADKRSHTELWLARDKVGPSSPEGQALAPAEHEAFIRVIVKNGPIKKPSHSY